MLLFPEGGMPEDRVENQRSSSKPVGGAASAPVDPALSASDTKMEQDTVTPEEHDPLWEELGATHVTEGGSDSAHSGVLNAPDNYTELTPSRILGKNLIALGDFRLLKKLGEGAMGAVYKAMQVSFKRTVVLKVLFPHVAKIPKLVERLYREGRVMGQLDHPNIVQAFAVGEAEGCHYIAMEYVSGQSMQKWLGQLGRVPVGDAVRIALDCAKALKYAHDQNMVHRDIKPDNILVTRSGMVKVADLGMVKIENEEMSLTQTGHAVGTPWYMPLEQARNAKEIDGRSDIYALGCTLYAMLTGQPPFVGRTIVEVIQAKELGTFPPARNSNAGVPERLDLLIAKMTAKSPKYRYQNCDDLIKDLESLQLASETLSFIRPRPTAECHAQETPIPGRTVVASERDLAAEAEVALETGPKLDPDQWYVHLKRPDGTTSSQKYTTAQVLKMLTEGTMKPTARASHAPDGGFRALGTYKEFQGTAMSQLSKKAADKNSARYRGIYKKIEEADREAARKELEAAQLENNLDANTLYWGSITLKVVPIGIATVGILIALILLLVFLF
jgi:serine/threonine-protein kinase